MSLIALAEAIDRLVEIRQAYIAESEGAATLSALSVASASELRALCEPAGLAAELFDGAGESWPNIEPLDAAFGPFRLVIQKPASPGDTLQLLSNAAFAQWLENGHAARYWRVARFTGSLATGGRVIQSWGGDHTQEPLELAPTKSPRALVKEFGNIRRVPQDIRLWITTPLAAEHFVDPATQVWVRAASAALISCLPDEIDVESGALKFRGPPRLTLPALEWAGNTLDHSTFCALVAASWWVFEHDREAEMRHILLAAELARSGAAVENTLEFLRQNLAQAWESAQIAYQMALADTSRDTLRVLSDLRKAVTEETAKLSDISRQLAGSVAAAVATGIGLIAARVAANAPAALIVVVMLVVAIYIAMVIASGIQFMRLQRQLRSDWQHRLYRFLPVAEYERMVAAPTQKAERSLLCSAWLGGVAISLLTLACGWTTLFSSSAIPAKPSPARVAPPTVSQPTEISNASKKGSE